MNIHAIQTGTTRIKREFQRGNSDRSLPAAFSAVLRDQPAIDLPIYAWLIEHDEGLFLVDTGENASTHMTPVAEMFVKPEEEVSAQLAARGIRPKDINRVILTHLHSDHIGGIAPFRETPVYVSAYDHAVLSSALRRRFSAMANPIPG